MRIGKDYSENKQPSSRLDTGVYMILRIYPYPRAPRPLHRVWIKPPYDLRIHVLGYSQNHKKLVLHTPHLICYTPY